MLAGTAEPGCVCEVVLHADARGLRLAAKPLRQAVCLVLGSMDLGPSTRGRRVAQYVGRTLGGYIVMQA